MATIQKTASETFTLQELTNSNPNSAFRPTDRFTFSELASCSGFAAGPNVHYIAVIDPYISDATVG